MISFYTLNRIAQCGKTNAQNQIKYRKVSIQERRKYAFLRQAFLKSQKKRERAKERGMEKG